MIAVAGGGVLDSIPRHGDLAIDGVELAKVGPLVLIQHVNTERNELQ